MIYADELIGRIMKAYDSQKFKNIMFIITGDTSNIMEGNITEKVPLIINLKSSKDNLVITDKINTLYLNELIINFFEDNIKTYIEVKNFFEKKPFVKPLPS